MNEFDTLYPKPLIVNLNGKPVHIKSVQLKDFETFGKAAGLVIDMIADQSDAGMAVLAKHTALIVDALVSCTSLSRRRINQLPASVVVELMIYVISANSRFFDHSLVKAEAALAGGTSSND